MDHLCLPLVDLLLQILSTESFDLVVHPTGLKTRKGGEGGRETPLHSPKRGPQQCPLITAWWHWNMEVSYLPCVLWAWLQCDGARQVGGDLEGKGG